VLENGRVSAEGTPEELSEAAEIEASYLGVEQDE
jgi:ABC-type branched-subunit amino acid transport system ATPase component